MGGLWTWLATGLEMWTLVAVGSDIKHGFAVHVGEQAGDPI